MELGRGVGDDCVVVLGRAPQEMKYAAVDLVDAYWEGLRDGRTMPDRSEIDPRGLEAALEYTFMLERVAPGVSRTRVAGMHLSDILGMEVRGMPFTAFFEPRARQRFANAMEQVISASLVAEMDLVSAPGIGRPELKARLFMAPLSSSSDGSVRVLGCLQSTGNIGRTPRRFEIAQVHLRRIVAAAGKAARPPLPQAPAMAFEEEQAPFHREHPMLRPTRHAHLRVLSEE